MITEHPFKRTELIDFLKSPRSYSDTTKRVDVKETHISIVFLTDHYAYKMKKPVRFDFLDFSSLALRRKACEEELKLNRRLAAGVYKAVVPVCIVDGRFVIGGQGEPVEWLVEMKRLEDASTLESLINRKQLLDCQVKAVADRLATFYSNLSPITAKPDEFRQELLNHINSNRDDLISGTTGHTERIQYVHSSQIRFLSVMADLFDARVCDGRVVDGHGDLKPEHIYFAPHPTIIDCVEFNSKYRQNDVIDELSFLAMECDRLNAPTVGSRIIDTYSQASNDFPLPEFVSFYKCYRACVRAKVSAMRAGQTTGMIQARFHRKMNSYLDLANGYSLELGPKLIITVGGLMGTGKSTLAQEISERLNAHLLQTDVIRHEIFPRNGQPLDFGSAKFGSAKFGSAKYSEANRELVYHDLFAKTPGLLRTSPTVILDGTFGRESLRQAIRILAKEVSAEWLHLECECPAEISLERIAKRQASRNSSSEARTDLYDSQVANYEPPRPSAGTHTVDTSQPLVQRVAKAIAIIRKKNQHASLFPCE